MQQPNIDLLELDKELSRREFWEYLKLSDGKFFKESRPHLKQLADTLQAFYQKELLNEDGKPYSILGISLPPRVGKSYTLTKFCQWILGNDNSKKIATVSYNEAMAGEFSRFVRDGIQEEKAEENELIFSDIFPNTVIKRGDASARKWALEGQFFNYIGTGMKGSLTGKGFYLGIIDDPVKSAEEAFNDRVLEEHYGFQKNTFRSRIEDSGLQIINHTRWSSNDLLGRLLEDQKGKIYHLVMQMEDESGNLLCEELCSRETFEDLKQTIDPHIFSANYMQVPIDIVGRMYKGFKTYKPEENPTHLPTESYTDTADTGADFLCSIAYKYNKDDGFVYIQDTVYNQEAMEVTEKLVAEMFKRNDTKRAIIESNNGGRGFARNVERILKEELNHNGTFIEWFHQGDNKNARIFSQSFWVTENILWPEGWAKRWPKLYLALSTYSKEGKNAHDDAPDCLTGVAEQITKPKKHKAQSYGQNIDLFF